MRRAVLIAACVACGRSGDGSAPPTGTEPAIPSDSAPPSDSAIPSARPNLLILLADDIGVDKIGAYAAHPDPPPTPTLDALAAEGVRFRNAWGSPVCSPARAAVLTGRYGRRIGLGGVLHPEETRLQLPRSELTLPELLATVGYHAEALGKWHLAGYTSRDGPAHPLASGFAHHRGSVGNLWDAMDPDAPATSYWSWEKHVDGVLGWSETFATTDTVDDAVARVSAMPEPWLLYVAFHAAHSPLSEPPPELHTQDDDPSDAPVVDAYDALVESLDTEIGRLLGAMDPEVRARTTIVFASDNGTPIFGTAPPWRRDHAKDTPFEGGIRVPLIVAGAGVAAPGREVTDLVGLVDLFPTLAHLAGADPSVDGAPPIDGVDLAPYLVGADTPALRRYVYTEKFGPNGPPPYAHDWRILRDDRWKLVRGYGDDLFFDLADAHPDDGGETANLLDGALSAEAAEAYERLSVELDATLERLAFVPPG